MDPLNSTSVPGCFNVGAPCPRAAREAIMSLEAPPACLIPPTVCEPEPRMRLEPSAHLTRRRMIGVMIRCLALVVFAFGSMPAVTVARSPEPIDFRREILPILSDHCFLCHGPDTRTRKADLRLDVKESALRSKDPIIVPGQSGESELILRVTSADPDEV